jgi:hypothetical protein
MQLELEQHDCWNAETDNTRRKDELCNRIWDKVLVDNMTGGNG